MPLSAGLLSAGALVSLVADGPAALRPLVPLGLCLAWVVWLIFLGVNNGFLFDLWNWYSPPPPPRPFIQPPTPHPKPQHTRTNTAAAATPASEAPITACGCSATSARPIRHGCPVS